MSLIAALDASPGGKLRAVPSLNFDDAPSGLGLSIEDLKNAAAGYTSSFVGLFSTMGQDELADHLAGIEVLSRTVEYLQVVAAAAVDRSSAAAGGKPAEGDAPSTATGGGFAFGLADGERSVYRCTAEYLQDRLRISRNEANRRLRLGGKLIPRTTLTAGPLPATCEHLAAGASSGEVSGKAATMISSALDRARFTADPAVLDTMESQLTTSATRFDPDFLSRLIRRWEAHLDPDGPEPTNKELTARQGVFLRGKKRGLHQLDIAATDEQYEYLITVMNTATNPRLPGDGTGTNTDHGDGVSGHDGGCVSVHGDGCVSVHDGGCVSGHGDGCVSALGDKDMVETRTRAQLLLDGLIGACQVALATDTLPATGGHRPQILVSVDYKTLLDDLNTRAGTSAPAAAAGASFAFTGPVNARTARKIACDADIIPVVLGGQNEILDLGRTRRLFSLKQRKALLARDKGCAFPGCTIPGHWTEAHHIQPWSHGGSTSTDNGVLLCSHHHHLIHQDDWTIQIRHRIPWFIPPPHIDPQQTPRRNHYWTLC